MNKAKGQRETSSTREIYSPPNLSARLYHPCCESSRQCLADKWDSFNCSASYDCSSDGKIFCCTKFHDLEDYSTKFNEHAFCYFEYHCTAVSSSMFRELNTNEPTFKCNRMC